MEILTSLMSTIFTSAVMSKKTGPQNAVTSAASHDLTIIVGAVDDPAVLSAANTTPAVTEGMAGADVTTITVTITPVNDGPEAAPEDAVVNPGAATGYAFGNHDFGFSDEEEDAIASITITQTHGNLFFDANDDGDFDDGEHLVQVNDVISYDDIQNLAFEHDDFGTSGSHTYSFTFRVIDELGLENTTDYTATLEVV